MGLHRVGGDRKKALMLQQGGQVGRGMLEAQFQGQVVEGADAQGLRGGLGLVHRLAVADQVEEVGISRGRRRLEDAPVGEYEVVRGDGPTIAPGRGLEAEGPGQAVGRDRVALRQGRDRRRFRTVGEEAGEEVGDDGELIDQGRLLGIQGPCLGVVSPSQAGLALRAGGAADLRLTAEDSECAGQGEEDGKLHVRIRGYSRLRASMGSRRAARQAG